MAASRDTVKAVLAIVSKYVEPDRVDALLTELEGVRGNVSFRTTITFLRKEYEDIKRKEKRSGEHNPR
jgi:hypothetical protein